MWQVLHRRCPQSYRRQYFLSGYDDSYLFVYHTVDCGRFRNRYQYTSLFVSKIRVTEKCVFMRRKMQHSIFVCTCFILSAQDLVRLVMRRLGKNLTLNSILVHPACPNWILPRHTPGSTPTTLTNFLNNLPLLWCLQPKSTIVCR